MPAIPVVTVTVQDAGASAALSVPLASIQLKIGCAVGGTVNAPYATTSPTSLQNQFIGGPIVEAGGLVCSAGNVVVAVSCPIATPGVNLLGSATRATVPNASTSAVTTSVDAVNGAWDTMYVVARCTLTGTIGVAPGPSVQVSLDAGRNWGAPISLGSANTLYLGAGSLTSRVPGGTGVQLNFGAGTLNGPTAGVYDTWSFGTIGPQPNLAGIQAAISAFLASQYAVAGVGSNHVVGGTATAYGTAVGGASAGDISGIQTSFQNGTSGYVYGRCIVDLRDAAGGGPGGTSWGGTSETEATWLTQLGTVVSGETAQPRVCADGGHYNMPSPYANLAGGSPSYRRPLSWSHAARRTQIPIERRAGRVLDGPYQQIAVSPGTDSTDGFVYHDERVTPSLNANRISSAMTWPRKGEGFFHCEEPLLSAPGSQFVELVIGNVLDAACNISSAEGADLVSDDLLTQSNGTLDPIELNKINDGFDQALTEGMTAPSPSLVSSVTAVASATQNVNATGIIPITVSVLPKGYVNAVAVTINLSTGQTG